MLKTITLDGKTYRWRDLLRLRKQQSKETRQHQPPLFEMKDDARPSSQTTVEGRFEEPTLFDT